MMKRDKNRLKMLKRAGKADPTIRHIAASKAYPENSNNCGWRKSFKGMGKFGAASDVKRIDPVTGQVIEVLNSEPVAKKSAKQAKKFWRKIRRINRARKEKAIELRR
jgi:hypothetical protein